MLAPAESIIDGTWGGDWQPLELTDFFLWRKMHWSPVDTHGHVASLYQKRFCLDFLRMIAEQEQRNNDRAQAQQRAAQHRG